MTAASAASCIAAEKAEPGSCQPNSAGTIRICAVEEIGISSVMPWKRPARRLSHSRARQTRCRCRWCRRWPWITSSSCELVVHRSWQQNEAIDQELTWFRGSVRSSNVCREGKEGRRQMLARPASDVRQLGDLAYAPVCYVGVHVPIA